MGIKHRAKRESRFQPLLEDLLKNVKTEEEHLKLTALFGEELDKKGGRRAPLLVLEEVHSKSVDPNIYTALREEFVPIACYLKENAITGEVSAPEEFRDNCACGSRIVNLVYLENKANGEKITLGFDCANRLSETLGINIGGDIELFAEEYAKKLPEKVRKKEKELKKIIDEDISKVRQLIREKKLEDMRNFTASTFRLLEKIHILIEHDPDHSIGLRALQKGGATRSWLKQEYRQGHTPEYIARITERFVNLPEHVSKQELIILYSYIASKQLTPIDKITDIVKDLKYYKEAGLMDLADIQHILDKNFITMFEIAELLSKQRDFFKARATSNLETLHQYGLLSLIDKYSNRPVEFTVLEAIAAIANKDNKSYPEAILNKFDDLIKEILPIYCQDRELWHEEFQKQRKVYEKALRKEEYAVINSLLQKWTFGLGDLPLSYDAADLMKNYLRLENIADFKDTVITLLGIQRKMGYVRAKLAQNPDANLSAMRLIPEEFWGRYTDSGLTIEEFVKMVEGAYCSKDSPIACFRKEHLAQMKEYLEFRLVDTELTYKTDSKNTILITADKAARITELELLVQKYKGKEHDDKGMSDEAKEYTKHLQSLRGGKRDTPVNEEGKRLRRDHQTHTYGVIAAPPAVELCGILKNYKHWSKIYDVGGDMRAIRHFLEEKPYLHLSGKSKEVIESEYFPVSEGGMLSDAVVLGTIITLQEILFGVGLMTKTIHAEYMQSPEEFEALTEKTKTYANALVLKQFKSTFETGKFRIGHVHFEQDLTTRIVYGTPREMYYDDPDKMRKFVQEFEKEYVLLSDLQKQGTELGIMLQEIVTAVQDRRHALQHFDFNSLKNYAADLAGRDEQYAIQRILVDKIKEEHAGVKKKVE